MRIVEFQMTLE